MSTNVSDPAAKPYAEALMQLAVARKCIGQVYEELMALDAAYKKDQAFRAFFTSPKVPAAIKSKIVLEAIPGMSETTRAFVTLLIRKRRESLLDNIVSFFGKYRDAAENRVHVFVESAVALESDQRAKLIADVLRVTGKDVQLHESVVPALIGGMRIRLGDKLLDTSIRRRLRELSATLLDQHSGTLVLASADDVDAVYDRAFKATVG